MKVRENRFSTIKHASFYMRLVQFAPELATLYHIFTNSTLIFTIYLSVNLRWEEFIFNLSEKSTLRVPNQVWSLVIKMSPVKDENQIKSAAYFWGILDRKRSNGLIRFCICTVISVGEKVKSRRGLEKISLWGASGRGPDFGHFCFAEKKNSLEFLIKTWLLI